MLRAYGPTSRPEVVMSYESPAGPVVRKVRGILLANSQNNLRTWGVYDAYLARLPDSLRPLLTENVAFSWVDVDAAAQHYKVAEELAISERDAQFAGEALAERVANTFMGLTVRAARRMGVQGFPWAIGRTNRMWERLYVGGSCTFLRFGPKEYVLEDRGNPLTDFRLYRIGYRAYMRAVASLFCKTVFVREVAPRTRHAHGHEVATLFSWV